MNKQSLRENITMHGFKDLSEHTSSFAIAEVGKFPSKEHLIIQSIYGGFQNVTNNLENTTCQENNFQCDLEIWPRSVSRSGMKVVWTGSTQQAQSHAKFDTDNVNKIHMSKFVPQTAGQMMAWHRQLDNYFFPSHLRGIFSYHGNSMPK